MVDACVSHGILPYYGPFGDIRDLHQVPSNAFHAVWSSHNLEHLFAHEVPLALAEFYRVLAPGGFVVISLPDFQAVAEEIAKGNLEGVLYESPAGPISAIDIMWGLRSAIENGNLFMAHKTGFTAQTLEEKLKQAGFSELILEREVYNLWAFGKKKPVAVPVS